MLKHTRLVACLFAAALGAVPAFGQAVSIAEVSGTISDQSGSAIPNAQVKIIETDKQTVHSTTSDSQGRYTLPNLPVGPYRLEATASGFKKYDQTGIELQVGNNVTINIGMQVGSVSESVEVQASAELVETRETSISQVIDEKRIVDLPLNGRQPTQLVLLSGAALPAPGGGMVGSKNYFSSVTISVAGGQANGVNYLLDGGDNVDAFSNVNLPIPFPDALQEFSVQTSSLPARYGNHPGGVVNSVTKSGTNGWHGDLFEFLRNGDVNARNFFAPVHDSLKRNQFGGTFGGKIKRDKLFFFGGYQGTRNRSDPQSSTAFVPTAAVFNGDFSALDSAACVSAGARTLKNPAGGTYTNNFIDPSTFNPIAVKFLKAYIPVSNDPCGRITYGIPTTGDEDQIIGRVDYVQSASHSIYARYFTAAYQNPPVFNGTNLLTTTAAGNHERAQSFTIGDTYTITPNIVNSAHATATRRRDDRGPADNITNPTALGIAVSSGIPNFVQISISNFFSVGCGTCAPGHFNTNAFQFTDDIDWVKGRHQIAFGANILRNQFNSINGFQENGSFSSNGSFTGDALADFLLGKLNDYQQSNPLQNSTRAWVASAYVQDTFKMSNRVTINGGLRWEPNYPAYDYFGHGDQFNLAAFNAGTRSSVFKNAPVGLLFYGDTGIPKAFSQGHTWLFSPRLGIAIDPGGNGKQTIRFGGAILRDTAELFYPERLTTNAPYASQIDIPNPAGGLSNPWQGYPGGNPFPGSAIFPAANGVYVNMPQQTNPTYMAQWNASYQRQFAGSWLATATYLGNKTTHIWVGEDINVPVLNVPGVTPTVANEPQRRPLYLANPTNGAAYSSITQSDQNGNSNYNGLLLSLQHRFSHHYTILTNYTWSKCISDVDFTGELAGSQYMNPYNRSQDRAACNFDIRHNSNTSFIVESPVRGTSFASKIISGWQLAPILSLRSGSALNVTLGVDNSLTGINLDRPNYVAGQSLYASPQAVGPGTVWLNKAAFTTPTLGTFGNLGRSAVRGPGVVNFDVSLSRTFALRERWRLETRFEAFNAINHANFSNPTVALNSANFGRILSAADPRILQFAMKLHF